MFTKKTTFNQHNLETVIDQLLAKMQTLAPNSDEYTQLTDRLETLYQLKDYDKSEKVDANTMWMVAGNLLGILTIVGYEQKHIITSKALSFLKVIVK